jgi:S1-C subfamily serine protease
MEGVLQTIDFSEQFLDAVLELPERPRLVKTEPKSRPGGGVAYLGITPDYSSDADGLKVVSVAPDSPAEKGGLQAHDVITHFGGNPVTDLPALTAGLRENKPGDTVNITVQRDGQTVSCASR